MVEYDADVLGRGLFLCQSHLFKHASAKMMDVLANDNVTMNNHHYGVTPDHFSQTPALADMFDVLSTNTDRLGKAFVSTVEAKKYPIWGTQWHPEKVGPPSVTSHRELGVGH
jgi:gamma-glutamyl hydrolase